MDAYEEYEKFKEKFKIKDLMLDQCSGWIVSLRPSQATLGSLVVSLNRPCLRFSEILPCEAQELSKVYKIVEDVLSDFVRFEKINYLSLMMVDSHLHFHVIPRYEGKRNFADVDYWDRGWPKLPDLGAGGDSEHELLNIKRYLKEIFISKKVI